MNHTAENSSSEASENHWVTAIDERHCDVCGLGAQEASDIWGPNTPASTGPDPVITSYDLVVLKFHPSDVKSSVIKLLPLQFFPQVTAAVHLILFSLLENSLPVCNNIEEYRDCCNIAKLNIIKHDQSAKVEFCRKKSISRHSGCSVEVTGCPSDALLFKNR